MDTVWDLSGTSKKDGRNISTIGILHEWNNTDLVQGFGRTNKKEWKIWKITRGIGNDSAQQGCG
jgi:hypothetical protein